MTGKLTKAQAELRLMADIVASGSVHSEPTDLIMALLLKCWIKPIYWLGRTAVYEPTEAGRAALQGSEDHG